MTTRIKRINITPDKSLFPKMGNTGYTVAEALSELIDNSVDAREENKPVEINIKIDKQKGCILVEDNGCGMDEKVASNSIKLGSSSKKIGELGQFGVGLKSACMSLGKKFTIETSPKGSDEECILVFDEDEFITSGSWSDFEIKIKKGTDAKKSFTKIKIEKLKIKFYGTFFDTLKKHLSERFTPFVINKEVKIKVNGEEIKAEPFEIFSDSRKEFEIKLSNGEEIRGWTGILKVGSVERSGFNIYRYNRLIRVHEKLGYIYHPSKMAITGEIYITADSILVTINKREFDTKNEFYIEFFEKFSEHLKPILAEVQKRHQEEKIKDLPRELKETLKDNILKALNEEEEFKELAFPGGKIKRRSKDEEGILLEKETRENSKKEIGIIENEHNEDKDRAPKKTSLKRARFIMIAGERYRFDYDWGALDEFTAKQSYLDKEKNTIMVILNTRYHILKILPKPDFFYHVIFLTEGIVEVFLKENDLSLEKVITLRDKLTKQLADIMAEDTLDEGLKKDSQVIEAQTYLLKPDEGEVSLNKNERLVLEWRIESGLTYQEIADELKVSRQRAEQLFRAGLNKINNIHRKEKDIDPNIKAIESSDIKMDVWENIEGNINSIIQTTAKMYNISVGDILGSNRQAEFILPRHTVMYILRKELNLSFPKIAEIMGKKDHSTIMYAYRKMKDLAEEPKLLED